MNILGMGPLELLVILGLALIVFGPEKLPEIGGQIGRAIRDFRRTTSDLSDEFSRNLKLELEERKAETQKPAAGALPYTPPEPPPSIAPPRGPEQLGAAAAETLPGSAESATLAAPAAGAEEAPHAPTPTSDRRAAASANRSDLEPPY